MEDYTGGSLEADHLCVLVHGVRALTSPLHLCKDNY